MGVLYARVGGAWVPVGASAYPPNSGLVIVPAFAGPRPDNPVDAIFSHTGSNKQSGFGVATSGTPYVATPDGSNVTLYEYLGGGAYAPFASFADPRSFVNKIGMGDHPQHGGYHGLWSKPRQESVSGADYIAICDASGLTLFNGLTQLELRANNQAKFVTNASDTNIYGTNTNVYGTQTNLRGENTFGVVGVNLATINSAGKVALQMSGVDIFTVQNDGWIRGMYSASFSYDVNCGRHMDVAQNFAAHNQVKCERGYADDNWPSAMFFNYQTGSTMANMSYHVPGSAPQIRAWRDSGEQIQFVSAGNNYFIGIVAASFNTSSSLTTKRDVRSLRPERERIVVDLQEPLSDVLVTPDIMGLRPVAFRPKEAVQRIVPAPGYDEYHPDDPDSWMYEDEPADEPLGIQGNRERLGLVADEVQFVVPSAVCHDRHGNPTGIDYAQITVALLDHVQELTRTVETLRYRITELEARP